MGYVTGRIRGSDLNPRDGLHVHVYTPDLIPLGSTKTKNGGFFKVKVNYHGCERFPDLYIIDEDQKRIILRIALEDVLEQRYSNSALEERLKKKLEKKLESGYEFEEIEYQIIIYDEKQTHTKNVLHETKQDGRKNYVENEKRTIRLFEKVEEMIMTENTINMYHQDLEGVSKTILEGIQAGIEKYPERIKNILDVLEKLISLFEGYRQLQLAEEAGEWGIILYDYDGPQIPANPSSIHVDVIIWPRGKMLGEMMRSA